MAITRNEGYRLGRSKEAAGLDCAHDLLTRLLGLPADAITHITDPDDNYRHGDLRLPHGHTIEVKRQPINPDRYRQNFVEVCEQTSNPRHLGGAADLATLLAITPEQLAATPILDHRHTPATKTMLGQPECISISIRSITASAATMYVNPDDGYAYLYPAADITAAIRQRVLTTGMRRGQGRSNEDTFAVMINLPDITFSRNDDGGWTAPLAHVTAARTLLAAPHPIAA